MRELLAELTAALAAGRGLVYCALVETRGSTPQKAGAAMLVFADGSQCGTLGGGCVEAEVKRRALHTLNGGGKAEVLTFYLDDNYGWDDGLICGGRMTILADPSPPADYYRRLRELVESGQGCTEAVAVTETGSMSPGSRCLFDAAGSLLARAGAEDIPGVVREQLAPLSSRPAATLRQGIAYLPVLPRVTLFIVGGGHVGQAVARLASEVDFDIWVLDDRDLYASRERFPTARRRLVGDIGAVLREAVKDIDASVYALIVTRGHSHDEEALYHLATTAAGYVGMIGSKRKIKLIYEDLLARGVAEEALARVHAPLGFDIGSQTVAEIAISIVAELIARRNLGRAGAAAAAAGTAGDGADMTVALVPAAGKSTRMGRPKLALPLGDRTVLGHVVAALRAAGLERVLVVVGPQGGALAELAGAAGAEVLTLAADTAEMRATVEAGLRWIEERFAPRPEDWLLAPADHPALDAAVVRRLLETRAEHPEASVIVPLFRGRRGHPTLIGWKHVAGIRSLPSGEGLNVYLRKQVAWTLEVSVATPSVLCDLDTPEDYQRLLREWPR